MNITNLSVCYGDKTIYSSFNVSFPEKKITCILGSSGCGKTTLLNAIAGIIPYTGYIDLPSKKISYMFQTPTLFAHLTVEKNIEYVLKNQIKNKNERKKAVDNILQDVELYDDRKLYPNELSGGMAQRVALARAFAYSSDLLIMDEPFKGMDVALKKKILDLFLHLYEKKKKTSLIVTHDIDEAILLADKILVLGRNQILYETELPKRKERSVGDFAEIRSTIYEIL